MAVVVCYVGGSEWPTPSVFSCVSSMPLESGLALRFTWTDRLWPKWHCFSSSQNVNQDGQLPLLQSWKSWVTQEKKSSYLAGGTLCSNQVESPVEPGRPWDYWGWGWRKVPLAQHPSRAIPQPTSQLTAAIGGTTGRVNRRRVHIVELWANTMVVVFHCRVLSIRVAKEGQSE